MIAVSGCVGILDYEFDQKITSGYSLGAIDVKQKMSLYVKDGDYTVSVVGPTVFSLGYNDSFIIVKQHPIGDNDVINKSIINYYIIPLTSNSRQPKDENKIGPLTEEQFEIQKQQLGVPKSIEFSVVFEDLK